MTGKLSFDNMNAADMIMVIRNEPVMIDEIKITNATECLDSVLQTIVMAHVRLRKFSFPMKQLTRAGHEFLKDIVGSVRELTLYDALPSDMQFVRKHMSYVMLRSGGSGSPTVFYYEDRGYFRLLVLNARWFTTNDMVHYMGEFRMPSVKIHSGGVSGLVAPHGYALLPATVPTYDFDLIQAPVEVQ